MSCWKDNIQAEGIYLLLKENGIDKPYEIVGERDRPYIAEQQAKRDAKKAAAEEEAAKKAAEEEEAAKKATEKKAEEKAEK